MLIELVVTFDTAKFTPTPERKDMADFINYHLSNAAHRVADEVGGHFGYPCTAKIRQTDLS